MSYTKIPDELAKRKDLTPAEKLVKARIDRYLMSPKSSRPSQEQIAEALGISVDTVQRAITKLQRSGDLNAERRPRQWRRNSYRAASEAATCGIPNTAECGIGSEDIKPQIAAIQTAPCGIADTAIRGYPIEKQIQRQDGEPSAAAAGSAQRDDLSERDAEAKEIERVYRAEGSYAGREFDAKLSQLRALGVCGAPRIQLAHARTRYEIEAAGYIAEERKRGPALVTFLLGWDRESRLVGAIQRDCAERAAAIAEYDRPFVKERALERWRLVYGFLEDDGVGDAEIDSIVDGCVAETLSQGDPLIQHLAAYLASRGSLGDDNGEAGIQLSDEACCPF